MTCNSYARYGFTSVANLFADIDQTLSSYTNTTGYRYFTRVYPSSNIGNLQLPAEQEFGFDALNSNILIYESRRGIDPLYDYKPLGTQINAAWRLAFVRHDQYRVTVHAGTELQYGGPVANIGNGDIASGNTIVFLNNRDYRAANVILREPPGSMNVLPWSSNSRAYSQHLGNVILDDGTEVYAPAPSGNVDLNNNSAPWINEVFINRSPNNGSGGAYPMNYRLTLTSRGIFLGVWEDNQEEIPQDRFYANVAANAAPYANSPIRWFLVQRSVDRLSGNVRGGDAMRGGNTLVKAELSRCPVFALFGTGLPNDYRKFIVRENDILTPTVKKPVTYPIEDSPAMINKYQQQSLTETGEFVVTFINNLSTTRFRYSDELDMMGTVGAEVIGAGTSINVRVYGETVDRTYTALYSNNPFGTGMRIMVLTAAGDADEAARD